VKELTGEELQEAGEFVEKRKLRAVGFLKVLSLDLRDLCTNGKEHAYEYDSSFDKEVHVLAKDIKDAKDIVKTSEQEVIECERIIAETTAKADVARQRSIESGDKSLSLLNKLGEMAYIKDESLWS